MRLRPEQLGRHLDGAVAKGALAPVYLLTGDETLLVQEAATSVRAACRKQGFGERQVFHVEANFDWGQFAQETTALSLFAERKLIELRMPTGKPGDAGSKAIEEYCRNPSGDLTVLIVCGKLDSAGTRTRWYKAVDAVGAVVTVWPIDATQLPRWIEQRLRSAGLTATPDAVQLLAERVEGNLLACAQEIERLRLQPGDGPITAETVAEVVAHSARFDVFGVAERALAGDTAGALRALAGLRQEGSEVQLLLWALAREIRTLAQCAEQLQQGAGIDRVLDQNGVWDRRKPLIRQALQRGSATHFAGLLQLAQRIDVASKGGSGEDSWQLLDYLVLGLASGASQPLMAGTFAG